MKTVYRADNSLEAYMILNLLQRDGITGRVDGEYLQGGIGELPPGGIVRVVVEDQDEARALSVIRTWESSQPKLETSPNHPQRRTNDRIHWFVLGMLTGGGLVWLYIKFF